MFVLNISSGTTEMELAFTMFNRQVCFAPAALYSQAKSLSAQIQSFFSSAPVPESLNVAGGKKKTKQHYADQVYFQFLTIHPKKAV